MSRVVSQMVRACALCVALLTTSPALADVHAMLIGNSSYDDDEITELKFPGADATALQQRLASFDVNARVEKDLVLDDFIDRFHEFIEDVDDGDTAIFYFSGHGLNFEGENYLIPKDFKLKPKLTSAYMRKKAISVEELVSDLQDHIENRAVSVIFIIDACRNDITYGKARTKDFGRRSSLRTALQPKGVFYLYSASTGEVSYEDIDDKTGDSNSIFTSALLDVLAEDWAKEVSLAEVAITVRSIVRDRVQAKSSAHQQTPAYIDAFYDRRNFLGDRVRPYWMEGFFQPGNRGGRLQAKSLPFCHWCPDFVEIKPGAFSMGSPGRTPTEATAPHDPRARDNEMEGGVVRLSKGYALGRSEVTRRDWLLCQADENSEHRCAALVDPAEAEADQARLSLPITGVSWSDVQNYLAWLEERAAADAKPYRNFRLPSEAEWEYAARAGEAWPYAHFAGPEDDASLCRFANGAAAGTRPPIHVNGRCEDAYGRGPAPADAFEANAFGLKNMPGNVWEWTADCYAPTHRGFDPAGAPRDVEGCAERTIRGGSWRGDASTLRSAVRAGRAADHRGGTIGFRIAFDLTDR